MARAATTTDVFDAIAERRRRQIIGLLSDAQAWAVNDLVARGKIPQPAVSKHLGVPRKVGNVGGRKAEAAPAMQKRVEQKTMHAIARENQSSNANPKRKLLMAVTITEQTVHSLDIVNGEEIAALIAVVFDRAVRAPAGRSGEPVHALPEIYGPLFMFFTHKAMALTSRYPGIAQGWAHIEGGWDSLLAKTRVAFTRSINR